MTFDDDRPFGIRLDELRREDKLTFRALEARLAQCAEPGERGLTNSHLAALTTGRSRPTPRVVALVARAFGRSPEEFVEWRLWQVQQLFDPERRDGFDAAIGQLHAFLHSADDDVVAALQEPAARESRRDTRALSRTAG
jgi:transcriptional regulator with XRE-family HTH domain